MNAEIYFPRSGKAFGQVKDKSFEATVRKLSEIHVNIIYKTEINLTVESVTEALRVSESGDDKIGMIFMADTLEKDSPEDARDFFESLGIVGKPRRLEGRLIDPMNPQEEETSSKRKKKKKKSGASGIAQRHAGQPIDISGGVVSIEPKRFYAYAIEYKNKLIVLLPHHENVDATFCTVLYTAAKKLVAPKKKRSFWKRIFPCRGDKPFDVIRKLILLLAICTFLVSSFMLLNIMVIEPTVQDQVTESVKKLKIETDEGTTPDTRKPTDGSQGVLSDFTKLLEANSDTIGWIKVPNTVIDYVVVRSEGDAKRVAEGEDPYYLYRDFYHKNTKYGSIFMDYRSTLDGKNIILHGHHMQDGRQFAKLTEFDNIDKYKSSPVVSFDTLYEKSKWKIFAVIKTNTIASQGPVFNYLRGSFSSDYDFLNFIYEVRVRSIIDCPVDINENDTILTLSTCAYDYEDFRMVVLARKVRDGESEEVDLSKAKYNPAPLYPDIWYEYRGGTKPEVTSFQDAMAKKQITWYSGSGHWSENDDKELEKPMNIKRATAEKQMRALFKKNDYEKEQQEELEGIITKYMELINTAKRQMDIEDFYQMAAAEIKAVKTKKQVADEKKKQEAEKKKQALLDAKTEAIGALNDTVAGQAYRMDDYNQIQKLIEEYTNRINKASSVGDVEKLRKQGVDALKKIKTDEQHSNDERQKLEQKRNNAVTELQNYLDPSEYSDATAATMRNIIETISADIKKADSESAVSKLLADAKKRLDRAAAADRNQESSEEESSEEESSQESSEEESSEEESSEESSEQESSEEESGEETSEEESQEEP